MKVFGILQDYKFAIDDVSMYHPVKKKQGIFKKRIKYGIKVILKSNPLKPIEAYFNKKIERDNYLASMDATFCL